MAVDTMLQPTSTGRGGRWRWRVNKKVGLVASSVVLFCFGILLYVHRVPISPTAEDVVYAERLQELYGFAKPDGAMSFEQEIEFIRKAQNAVLLHAPGKDGIPLSSTRELRDVFESKHGLCFDRSRAIETLLSVNGFEVRHISIFKYDESASRLRTLLRKQTPSHAISEVNTSRGWVVIDSNFPWISQALDGAPISLDSMEGRYSDIKWADSDVQPGLVLQGDFIRVYGLYSRHGRFYPPFNAIPDVSWSMFLDNFWGD